MFISILSWLILKWSRHIHKYIHLYIYTRCKFAYMPPTLWVKDVHALICRPLCERGQCCSSAWWHLRLWYHSGEKDFQAYSVSTSYPPLILYAVSFLFYFFFKSARDITLTDHLFQIHACFVIMILFFKRKYL